MKVVLGFSGGVDSAVSAALLRRAGWEVCGLYLDNTDENARRDAVETAAFLELPLEILDVRAELEEKVCAPFCQSYLRGETPNPCILCNPSVKFRALLETADRETADRLGAEAVATGHYARAEGGALYKGRPSNDQSYMLCRLRREQLDRLVLPLGEMEKTETRALAERLGLPVAHKKDSMEICFIPDRDYFPVPGLFSFTAGCSASTRASSTGRWDSASRACTRAASSTSPASTRPRTASSSRRGRSCSKPS